MDRETTPKADTEWKAPLSPNEEQAQKILKSNQDRGNTIQDKASESPHGAWDKFKSFFSKKEDIKAMEDMQEMNAKTDAYWKDIKDRKQPSLHASEGQSAKVYTYTGEFLKDKSDSEKITPAYMDKGVNQDIGTGGSIENTEAIPPVEDNKYKDVLKPEDGEEKEADEAKQEVAGAILNKIDDDQDAGIKNLYEVAAAEQEKMDQQEAEYKQGSEQYKSGDTTFVVDYDTKTINESKDGNFPIPIKFESKSDIARYLSNQGVKSS